VSCTVATVLGLPRVSHSRIQYGGSSKTGHCENQMASEAGQYPGSSSSYADFCANSSESIPSSTLRALAISHAPDRALGLKAAVVLPFGQPVGVLIHPQSVSAIDLGRQTSRDLTSEAMKPREAA
jgi:hypothetical protein